MPHSIDGGPNIAMAGSDENIRMLKNSYVSKIVSIKSIRPLVYSMKENISSDVTIGPDMIRLSLIFDFYYGVRDFFANS